MILARLTGHLLAGDVVDHLAVLRADRKNVAGLPVFVDCRGLTTALTSKELRAIATTIRASTKAGVARIRCAMFVETDLMFGLVRMFEAYADGVPLSISAFHDRAEALHWLKHPSQS